MLEPELHRSALHSAVRSPWTLGIGITLGVSVIDRIGVDDQRRGTQFLRQISLYAAEILSIANDYDLAADVNAELFQFLEIFRPAVIGIDDIGRDIPRGGVAVESRHHLGIVLEGVIIHLLGRRSVHDSALSRKGVNA